MLRWNVLFLKDFKAILVVSNLFIVVKLMTSLFASNVICIQLHFRLVNITKVISILSVMEDLDFLNALGDFLKFILCIVVHCYSSNINTSYSIRQTNLTCSLFPLHRGSSCYLQVQ